MRMIKCDVRMHSDKGNPTTLGLGCLWSGERIRRFHNNLYYKVSEENRPVEWKLNNEKDMDLVFSHFNSPAYYEKIAGPSPYYNNQIYNHEYDNVPARKLESEELCIFPEVHKHDFDLLWIHTSIIKGGIMSIGAYDIERVPSLIRYDIIRKDKIFKKKVYEFGLRRYKQVIKYLQQLAKPDEIFIITTDHGTLVDVNEPLEPQIDDIPLIINRDIDLKSVRYQWNVKDLILRMKNG